MTLKKLNIEQLFIVIHAPKKILLPQALDGLTRKAFYGNREDFTELQDEMLPMNFEFSLLRRMGLRAICSSQFNTFRKGDIKGVLHKVRLKKVRQHIPYQEYQLETQIFVISDIDYILKLSQNAKILKKWSRDHDVTKRCFGDRLGTFRKKNLMQKFTCPQLTNWLRDFRFSFLERARLNRTCHTQCNEFLNYKK